MTAIQNKKQIRDPVHGDIEFDKFELDIIIDSLYQIELRKTF